MKIKTGGQIWKEDGRWHQNSVQELEVPDDFFQQLALKASEAPQPDVLIVGEDAFGMILDEIERRGVS